jgi:hypothetical protein
VEQGVKKYGLFMQFCLKKWGDKNIAVSCNGENKREGHFCPCLFAAYFFNLARLAKEN